MKRLIMVSVIFFAASIFALGRMEEQGTEVLQKAIARAAVQCYAIEGRYPPDLSYLEKYYGICVDTSHYAVFYNGFASNIMPEITVNRLKSREVLSYE